MAGKRKQIHKVNDEEIESLRNKAQWLRQKIDEQAWPMTPGRPLFVAPTAVTPGNAHGRFAKMLAMNKMLIVRKGDRLVDLLA